MQHSNATKSAFGNTFEMLSFQIGNETFGINIFKVKEIVQISENEQLSRIPHSHSYIIGLKKIRDKVIPVFDTRKVISGKSTDTIDKKFLLVIEVSNSLRGLLVDNVTNISHIPWANVVPSPQIIGKKAYISSVVNIDSAVTAILDVEKILSEIDGNDTTPLNESSVGQGRSVLIVDDSLVAYNQVARCAKALGFNCIRCANGKEAWEYLSALVDDGVDILNRYPLLIIDVEMPLMDGYELTRKIRNESRMSNANIMINSSLSSNISKESAYHSGANVFLSKFSPMEIQSALKDSVAKMNCEKKMIAA